MTLACMTPLLLALLNAPVPTISSASLQPVIRPKGMEPGVSQLDLKAAAALALPQRLRPEQGVALITLGM